MKNFLKAVALICFGGALLVGIMVGADHVKDNEKEEKEEKVETLTLTIEDGEDFVGSIEIEYEEGMTWGEWLDSEYNNHYLVFDSVSTQSVVSFKDEMIHLMSGLNDDYVKLTDLIDSNIYYYFAP